MNFFSSSFLGFINLSFIHSTLAISWLCIISCGAPSAMIQSSSQLFFSFPVYDNNSGEKYKIVQSGHHRTSLFNFVPQAHFITTRGQTQGLSSKASQPALPSEAVHTGTLSCLLFDGTSQLIISTAGPQGENKGSAERALVAL